jgi:iron(III)-salmochelin esterase
MRCIMRSLGAPVIQSVHCFSLARSAVRRSSRRPWAARLCAALPIVIACARAPRSQEEEPSRRSVALIAQVDPVVTPHPSAPTGIREAARELSWSFPEGPFGATEVVIAIPPRTDAQQRFPVLVALHGRGESVKGSRRGARGWLDDYQLARAVSRLSNPPLRAPDFEDFVGDERLARLNAGLLERPYSGLIVVCPFLPDVLKGSSAFRQAEPLARFIVDVLLPRVYAKTPALAEPASTGIDGVSLGGRAALLVGLSRPEAFGAVGALQAAIDEKELERWSEMAARAVSRNPRLVLRLLTSDEDYFLRVNEQLSSALTGKAVPHRLLRVVGTHSYRFNRGPGSLEMLLFHDRVLRGLPSP